jgi:hypothetical protein
LVMAFLAAVVATILYFIYSQNIDSDLALLALNSSFLIILYVFLVINAVEFYPHSVRTLGLGFVLCFYCFGQLFFSVYLISGPKAWMVIELFLWGSWIMFGHCWGLK